MLPTELETRAYECVTTSSRFILHKTNCTNQSVLKSRATIRVFFVSYVNIPTVEILIALINIFVEPK